MGCTGKNSTMTDFPLSPYVGDAHIVAGDSKATRSIGREEHTTRTYQESTIPVHVMGLGKKTSTLLSWMYAKLLQSCPTLCYSVHGMFQAGIQEWAAMPSSRDQPCISCTSCISDGFFNSESQGKPPSHHKCGQRMPPTISVKKVYQVTKPMCTLRGFWMERNMILP